MKYHIGVDVGTGYVHAVTATPANAHDISYTIFRYNKVMTDVPRIVADCETMRKLLTDTADLDRQIEEKAQESELLADMVRELMSTFR